MLLLITQFLNSPTTKSVFALDDIEQHHHLDELIEPIDAIVEPLPPTIEKNNRKEQKK